MKKIILAFDGAHFSEGAFQFASRLNEKEPILLTGVFVPLVNYSSLWSYASATAMAGGPVAPLLEQEEVEELQKNIDRFQESCIENNIEFQIDILNNENFRLGNYDTSFISKEYKL